MRYRLFFSWALAWFVAGAAAAQTAVPDSCPAPARRMVRVNIHFVQDEAGGNNFQPVDDPATPLDENGYHWAEGLISYANWPRGWSENPPMTLPVGNTTPNPPKRIQLLLTGVYFDRAPAEYQRYTDTNSGSSYLFDHFGRDKGRAINVFVQDRDVPGSTGGIADGIGPNASGAYWCKILSPWYGARLPKPIGAWAYGSILNHELGHVLGLAHTYSMGSYNPERPVDWDGCPDTPDNPNCWDENDRKCTQLKVPEPPSNNQMDYNNVQNALTPCQLARIHANLAGPMRGLVAACAECPPTHAFFGLAAGGRAVERRFDPKKAGSLLLDGTTSANERRFAISIQRVDPADSNRVVGAPVRRTWAQPLDELPAATVDLAPLGEWRRRRAYRITLSTANDCGADSLTRYVSTRPLTRRERRAAKPATIPPPALAPPRAVSHPAPLRRQPARLPNGK